jgi:pimeloyl-ACP methyl ester carboxylesterase
MTDSDTLLRLRAFCRPIMTIKQDIELLLLHALSLDGSMWAAQQQVLPGATHAPTLYAFGDRIEDWAAAALKLVRGDRLVVVGCPVGGSCALELAAIAPERVAALVLIGTKAGHRRDPTLHHLAVETLQEKGMEEAWDAFWAPLFSRAADSRVIFEAKQAMLRQTPSDLARGITAFHSRPSRDQFLRTFSRPVIVVMGADDVAPGPAVSKAQADSAPRGWFMSSPHAATTCRWSGRRVSIRSCKRPFPSAPTNS